MKCRCERWRGRGRYFWLWSTCLPSSGGAWSGPRNSASNFGVVDSRGRKIAALSSKHCRSRQLTCTIRFMETSSQILQVRWFLWNMYYGVYRLSIPLSSIFLKGAKSQNLRTVWEGRWTSGTVALTRKWPSAFCIGSNGTEHLTVWRLFHARIHESLKRFIRVGCVADTFESFDSRPIPCAQWSRGYLFNLRYRFCNVSDRLVRNAQLFCSPL